MTRCTTYVFRYRRDIVSLSFSTTTTVSHRAFCVNAMSAANRQSLAKMRSRSTPSCCDASRKISRHQSVVWSLCVELIASAVSLSLWRRGQRWSTRDEF